MSDDVTAAEIIAGLRGGWGTRCDFCHEEKPPEQLDPEEAGQWMCSACWARQDVLWFIANPKSRQRDVALAYARAIDALPPGLSTAWIPINEAITARWPKGLERVKKLAWKTRGQR